jgi:hypothetical protein
MSNLAIQLWPEALRSIGAGAISGTYMGIGLPTTYPTRIYWIQNNTDANLTFSWDGITDHFVVPQDGFLLLDGSANKSTTGGIFSIPAGTRTYVKGAPTTGNVDLTVFYGRNG